MCTHACMQAHTRKYLMYYFITNMMQTFRFWGESVDIDITFHLQRGMCSCDVALTSTSDSPSVAKSSVLRSHQGVCPWVLWKTFGPGRKTSKNSIRTRTNTNMHTHAIFVHTLSHSLSFALSLRSLLHKHINKDSLSPIHTHIHHTHTHSHTNTPTQPDI